MIDPHDKVTAALPGVPARPRREPRIVTQFAGHVQHFAAVVTSRRGGKFVIPETVRARRRDASEAYQLLGYTYSGTTRIERVYLSWEVQVELPPL